MKGISWNKVLLQHNFLKEHRLDWPLTQNILWKKFTLTHETCTLSF